ncbi:MAG TPA: Smr/MutS family protein [Terracidiphilus sp.]|nr:Smr/MutS family protein [Terracidiphilus sp.]
MPEKHSPDKLSIDLHGLRVRQALDRFVWFYNDCVRRGVKGPIEVVHGYGAASEGGGEIRRELRGFLAAHEDCVAGWVAGDGIGNPGVTRVWIGKRLPEGRETSR